MCPLSTLSDHNRPIADISDWGHASGMGYEREPNWRERMMGWLFARNGCLIVTLVLFVGLWLALKVVVALVMAEPECVFDNPPCMP